MGNLGEEDLEKLVPDYIESSIRVPDHMEKSSTAIVTLQEILRAKGEKEKEMEENVKSFIRSIILPYEGDDEKRDAMKKMYLSVDLTATMLLSIEPRGILLLLAMKGECLGAKQKRKRR